LPPAERFTQQLKVALIDSATPDDTLPQAHTCVRGAVRERV
jgi:hypothetical protein